MNMHKKSLKISRIIHNKSKSSMYNRITAEVELKVKKCSFHNESPFIHQPFILKLPQTCSPTVQSIKKKKKTFKNEHITS